MKEIMALTSLRGIFAMWVVLFHLRAWSDFAHTPLPIVDRGYLGVDFFFMLSGFILAARHGAEFTGAYRPATHLGFLIKRFGRMFPLHWVVLAAVVLSTRLIGQPSYWWTHIASEAALIHRWDVIYVPRAALNGPDWSISTEWAANILFPAFVALTGFGSRRGVWAVGVAAICLATIAALAFRHGDLDIAEANSPLPLIRCFAEFALGMVLFQWREKFRQISGDATLMYLFAALAVGLILRADLLVVGLMVGLLPALALSNGRVAGALSRRPLHYLGAISYSVYLVQLPIILAVDWALAGTRIADVGHWVVPLALIFAVASGTYRFIERPANRLLKSAGTGIGFRAARLS